METGQKKKSLPMRTLPLHPSYSSLPRRDLFVLWGGWGERKREGAGHDGKGEERREAPAFSLFPSSAARFLFFYYCYFIGIPWGSLCGGESLVVPCVHREIK